MTAYKKLVIYYFSGTGNSRNVAVWLADSARDKNILVKLFDISQSERRSLKPPPEEALLIFISPIHGFNYPPIMLNFIAHFPRGKNDIVLMNTRAGMLIKRWITPGLTGIAFYFSALLLKVKGYSIKGLQAVDLPSNWISVHPGLNDRTVKFIHEKIKALIINFADKILSGKSSFKALYDIIQDALMAPIAVLYYFIGRFFLSKTYFASSDCDNCGACIKNCPVKAIIEVDKRPFWTYRCESCMRCMGNCPKKSIETAHGFAFGIWAFYSFVLSILFYKYFALYFFSIKNEAGKFIIETTIFLSATMLSYRMMHYLLRFKLFERLFVYTSLTKYRFWGRRYKAPKP
jgi:Pyruvate/2-oxoacid:ferredoxin oxidoreductase delta subunit